MAFPKLKLSDADGGGRAVATRLAFFIGNVPFEDDRIPAGDLAATRSSRPYGVVPVLQVDGEVLGESGAIARYAGRLAGLYPRNNATAALLVDEIMQAIHEFGEKFHVRFSATEPAHQQAEEAKLLSETIPRYLSQIDARLEKTQQHVTFSMAQAEGRLFIHELWLYQFLTTFLRAPWLGFVPNDIADDYKNIMACEQRVMNHPRVREWNELEKMRPTSLKLIYFDYSGLAECIRVTLHVGGVAFEDERLGDDEDDKWTSLKPTLPYGKVPVLLINGELQVAQSLAILRYVGTITGLYPSNDELLVFRIDEILAVLGLLDSNWYPGYALEMDEETELKMRTQAAKEAITRSLGGLDKRVAAWSKPYATGEKLTVADMCIYGVVLFLKSGEMEHVPKELVETFPSLIKIYDLVRELPQVQTYNASLLGGKTK